MTELIHALFEARVAKDPGSIALIYGDRSITYSDLNARSNRIAHTLIQCGASRGIYIGHCVTEPLDSIATVFGVLKTGGTLVVLRPYEPAEHLVDILDRTHAWFLVTDHGLRAKLRTFPGQAVVFGTDEKVLSEHLATDPESQGAADDPAYILPDAYGSGSGALVGVTHQAVVRSTGDANGSVSPLQSEERADRREGATVRASYEPLRDSGTQIKVDLAELLQRTNLPDSRADLFTALLAGATLRFD